MNCKGVWLRVTVEVFHQRLAGGGVNACPFTNLYTNWGCESPSRRPTTISVLRGRLSTATAFRALDALRWGTDGRRRLCGL